jgi:two-component system, sensor histidine kinase and response regulator
MVNERELFLLFMEFLAKPVIVEEIVRRPTLLIVDDEEGPRQALRIIFKDDYNILVAENGAKALMLAQKHSVDAAVLDIRMAGLSGIDVLHQIKQMDPGTEVIMLTAYETLETARQALRLGACDYLDKPFDVPAMRCAVRKAMERRGLLKEFQVRNKELSKLQSEIYQSEVREEQARTRGEIYASIIHDISGPLSIITGFIEMVNQAVRNASRIEGDDLTVLKDRLTRISRQVQNCAAISRRYLGFLRDDPEDHSPVSVEQILTDLKELLKTHPSSQGHELAVRSSSDDLGARINGTDLIQILLNLTINAFQCSDQPHQVEVTGRNIDAALPLLEFTNNPNELFLLHSGFANEAPMVAVEVRDDGPGIQADLLGRIFDPYVTTKRRRHGTGLGLSIVKRLVEQAQGAIHVRTMPGEGTRFTVYLPAYLGKLDE